MTPAVLLVLLMDGATLFVLGAAWGRQRCHEEWLACLEDWLE